MLFNSLGYILFMVVALALSAMLPRHRRFYLFGLLSVLFYSMWRWEYSLLIVLSAFVDFMCAKGLVRTEVSWKRKLLVCLSLSANLAILVFFKYSYFIYHQAWRVTSMVGFPDLLQAEAPFQILLPLGVSFYTFQTISYTLDVYRKEAEPVHDFFLFFTYVSFWPQLVAGPILRASEVVTQLRSPAPMSIAGFAGGLERVLFGLFKKVVLADSLAGVVEKYFDGNMVFTGPDVWVMTFLFGFQIYFDFSGYSDIAIGSARMVGISFPENFRWPYLAVSPRDFWKRWHISLSAWIRDYLYLPLTHRVPATSKSTGGIAEAFEGQGRSSGMALFLTWIIMGFWHGAGWTFGLWGLYHATVVYAYRKSRLLRRMQDQTPVLSWITTLLAIMAGWVLFRAHSVGQAVELMSTLLNPVAYLSWLSGRQVVFGHYLIAFLLTGGMFTASRIHSYFEESEKRRALIWRLASIPLYAVVTVCIIVCIRPGSQFIYFQF